MKLPILSLVCALAVTSCQTTDPYTGVPGASKTTTGAVLGGLLGAGVGALSGDGGNDSRQKAVRGAAIGALAGGAYGNYMDRQEAELRQELASTGVGVSRNGDRIVLNMPSDITFPTGEARISPDFFPVLNSVAKVLYRYRDSSVAITGHTDNVGGYSYNQRLSATRASNVASYLAQQRVDGRRMQVSGQGYSQPIASNNSESGRAQNRRVTIELAPLQR
ncbi:MAG: OmpA family protein [Verrucomicrobiaceae bacterium]